jgi:hypothetical protein
MQFMIDGKTVEADEVRVNVDGLQVVVTHEGIILDSFDDDDNATGTKGMTFDEWRESIEPKPVNEVIARLQARYGDKDGSELDEVIHEQFAATASAYNNEGIHSQIEQLVQHMGEEAATETLREVYGE